MILHQDYMNLIKRALVIVMSDSDAALKGDDKNEDQDFQKY